MANTVNEGYWFSLYAIIASTVKTIDRQRSKMGGDGNGPYFRAKVVVLGTAAVVVGLVTCVFATVQIVQIVENRAPGDLTPSIVVLVAAVGLIAVAMAMMKRPN